MLNNEIVEILRSMEKLLSMVTSSSEMIRMDKKEIGSLSEINHRTSSLEEFKEDYFDLIEKRKNGLERERFISSGFAQLDELTGGFFEGELIIIGSRPGIGKTGVMLSMILNHLSDRIPVAIYSLELDRVAITDRLLSMYSKIPVSQMRNGKLTAKEFKRIAKAFNDFSQTNMFFIEGNLFRPDAFSTILSKLISEKGIRILYIDYLQLMISNRPGRNREQEVSELMRYLKSIALELKIPIIIASQMNRYVEWRGGSKRPFLSDLRESGSIEEIADKVLFIYRAEAYGIPMDEEGNSTAGKAELIVGKNRLGPRGECVLTYNRNFGLFENINWDKNVFPSLNLSDNPFNEGPF